MLVLLRSLSIAALLFLAGCGRGYHLGQVEGAVRAGGKPLGNVVVTFIPESTGDQALPRSLAQSNEAGRYTLQIETQGAGAVVGKHRVVVEDLAILNAPRAPDGTVLKRPHVRFSARYSDPLGTPLLVEVKAGLQTIDLELGSGE